MPEHNEAQLDFILEMYAADHPKEYAFRRHGAAEDVPASVALTGWADVLTGKSLKEFLAQRQPSARTMEILRARSLVRRI